MLRNGLVMLAFDGLYSVEPFAQPNHLIQLARFFYRS